MTEPTDTPTCGAPHPWIACGLFTDLYELTMAQAYRGEGISGTAVFELFFRELPRCRRFAIAAGLADALDAVEHLRFSGDDIDYLRQQDEFDDPEFLQWLRDFRFTGSIFALPEGTAVFPDEPLVQVVAPLPEAQLVETLVLNQVHVATVIASKAARVVLAAGGRTVVDFGSRRAHGADAAVKAARTCYLVGAAGTSNVLAGRLYGAPVFGTMAHSYVQAHGSEAEAFRAFAKRYPATTLLVDTYDTLDGVRRVIDLARQMGDAFTVRAVRLDSGDLGDLARKTRELLDAAGMETVKIFASGGLDEHRLAALLSGGVPIDGFGVGTRMVVAPDAPTLDVAYKLVAYDGQPRTKLSEAKAVHPWRKQVFRSSGPGGAPAGDLIGRCDETPEGRPLLVPVMRDGTRTDAGREDVETARQRCRATLEALPEALKRLEPRSENEPQGYPVDFSALLQDELARLGRDARA